jgi:hypothetical protein
MQKHDGWPLNLDAGAVSWSKQKTVAVFEDIHHRAHPSSGRRLQRRTRSVKETEGTVEAASEAVR